MYLQGLVVYGSSLHYQVCSLLILNLTLLAHASELFPSILFFAEPSLTLQLPQTLQNCF